MKKDCATAGNVVFGISSVNEVCFILIFFSSFGLSFFVVGLSS